MPGLASSGACAEETVPPPISQNDFLVLHLTLVKELCAILSGVGDDVNNNTDDIHTLGARVEALTQTVPSTSHREPESNREPESASQILSQQVSLAGSVGQDKTYLNPYS